MAPGNQGLSSIFSKDKIHKVFSIYSEKSSVSGLPFIKQSKYPVVRILWSLLLIFALLALTVHLTLLFIEYYSYEKHSVTSLNFSVLPFPAISFCNVNPIRMSKLDHASPELQKLVRAFNPTTLLRLEAKYHEMKKHKQIHDPSKSHAHEKEGHGVHKHETDEHDDDGHDDDGHDKDGHDKDGYHEDGNEKHDTDDSSSENSEILDSELEYLIHYFNEHLGSESNIMYGEFDVDSFLKSDWSQHTPHSHGHDNGHEGHEGEGHETAKGQEWDGHATVSKFDKIRGAFRILLANETLSARREMGHSLEDFLIHCSFAGRKCKASEFTSFASNHYGNCYTVKQDEMVVTRDGPLSGLHLILYIQGEDRVKGFTNAKGVQLVIHEAGTIPAPYDDGFSVSAGTHSMIGIRMHDIKRLSHPYGECVVDRSDGVLYSRGTCQKFCQMIQILEDCSCVDVTFSNIIYSILNRTDTNVMPCRTKEERHCAAERQRKSAENHGAECDCKNPCKERKFIKSVSSRLWPDDDYAAVLVNAVCQTQHGGRECAALKEKHRSRLREEFVKLSIFYEDLNYEQLQEVPNYQLVNLLSDIGGTVGLWIGLSLLSMVEIIHLITSFVFTTCLAGIKRRFKKKDDHAHTHDADAPLTDVGADTV